MPEYKYVINKNFELEQAQQKQMEEDAARETYEKIRKMRDALYILSDNERRVVQARFLYDDDNKKVGLVELGQELGMSAEAVRKMQLRALLKLHREIEK
jgi:RNA polymerase sigma factor (sigma-70 family)